MFIIAGLYRRQRLITPKGSQTRPTASRLREALFNICQQRIEGARFLDLFAGSGAMGLEALSRGAQSVTFVDSHKEAIFCIETNVQHLNIKDKSQILKGEVFSVLNWLEKQNQTFDVIYADPPYQTATSKSSQFYSHDILQWMDTHPLLVPGGILFIEEDFHSQPLTENLKTLSLINSRRMGHSALQQYKKINNKSLA